MTTEISTLRRQRTTRRRSNLRNLTFSLIFLLAPVSAHALFLDCVFFDGLEAAGTTDPAELDALQVHNCARKTVLPAASPALPMLTWSATVAASAQSWADGCVYGHGGHAGYGQNIYAAAGFVPTLSGAALAWVGEQPYFDYASNTCATGEQCGHYTQAVWRSTTQVGCGQTSCNANSPFAGFPNWTFIVCNYSPPGNFVGQRPY